MASAAPGVDNFQGREKELIVFSAVRTSGRRWGQSDLGPTTWGHDLGPMGSTNHVGGKTNLPAAF